MKFVFSRRLIENAPLVAAMRKRGGRGAQMKISGKIRLAFALLSGLAPLAGWSKSIDVLWYTYAHPSSIYVHMIKKLAEVVHSLPPNGGLAWKLTFFGPASEVPEFSNYNVLVIQSGEAFLTGQFLTHRGVPDPKEPYAKPDYSGILKNKRAIEAARGERTFISGSDADIHAIRGDSGNAPSVGGQHVTCKPPIVGSRCWDGALGHLVNAVNWAGSGSGLGIVSLVAGEFPGSRWWLDANSFLRAELGGYVTIWGNRWWDPKQENNPVIPAAARGYPLNSGLTSKGLGNWRNSFHFGFSHSMPGYAPIVDSTRHPDAAVAIATAKFAGAGTGGPAPIPALSMPPPKRDRRTGDKLP